MREIRELVVKQIRIFPIDEIGFQSLQRQNAIKQIQEKYSLKFNPIMFEDFSGEQPNIVFKNGEYQHKNKPYLIELLSIEPRRILIHMCSNSKIADSFFTNLRDLLISLDLREGKSTYKPLLKSEETECVVKFDFCYKDIFKNSPIYDFNDYLTKNITSHACKIEVLPSALRFRISYLQLPDSLKKQKVTLDEKYFVIEIRTRTSYEDQIYFTFSPTDTETHFKLLNELEKRIISS